MPENKHIFQGVLARLVRAPRFFRKRKVWSVSIFLMGVSLATALASQGQSPAQDPGPRAGSVAAGQSIQGMTADEQRFFLNGQARFQEIDSVTGSIPGETGVGLGPGFNANQCSSCHAQPSVGGSSPSLNAFPNIGPNPQVAAATLDNATNTVPSFITLDGPVREARFKFVTRNNGSLTNTPDGGVHDLFTITGRSDATGPNGTCQLQQPNFEQALSTNNVSFRIPTPVFGEGLIENIDESTIESNMQAQSDVKQALGISGHPNRNGNDGTISRFGWKAQNKSLELFAAEAYNVEMGVTNEIFPNERGYPPNPLPANCIFNGTPEDRPNYTYSGTDDSYLMSDSSQFATFMRFLDQPTPSCTGTGCSQSIQNGRHLFVDVVKCSACHTPSMTTSASSLSPALAQVKANLYSDLLVHNMGSGLADGVAQGGAAGDEFRTSPLWGLGQRVFFLHDGRTSDLLQAILQHAGPQSEANQVIHQFKNLNENQKQDLLNFLRSL